MVAAMKRVAEIRRVTPMQSTGHAIESPEE